MVSFLYLVRTRTFSKPVTIDNNDQIEIATFYWNVSSSPEKVKPSEILVNTDVNVYIVFCVHNNENKSMEFKGSTLDFCVLSFTFYLLRFTFLPFMFYLLLLHFTI